MASASGIAAGLLLPFATLRASRIQSGIGVPSLDALESWQALALLLLWLSLAALSIGRGRAGALSAARGLVASGAIVALVWLSGDAAARLGALVGGFARVSVGAGVWVGVVAAQAVVLASRRELRPGGRWSLAVSLAAPAGLLALLASGALDATGMAREYANQGPRFWAEAWQHLALSAASAGLAVLVGVPLGVLAFRRRSTAGPILALVGAVQTIPGLAMIGILVAPLAQLSHALPWLRSVGFGGLGWAPVVIALTLYALLPVVRNTYAGLRGVPPETVDAGIGMGMTPLQVLARVRLPMAAPVITSGLRTAGVQAIGNATLGAFAAAGTLGLFVFGGLAQQSADLMMVGSVAIVVLAVGFDAVLRAVQRVLWPAKGGVAP